MEPKMIESRLGLTVTHSSALSELIPLLLCGEESAVLAFSNHARSLRWSTRAREEFTRMEVDEARHAHWLHGLQLRLPMPGADSRLQRRMKHFLLGLASADFGMHLGQVAALDSAVCLILGRLRRAGACEPNSPVARVFEAIHRDEARHVAIARAYARELCSTAHLRACVTETREQLAGILSARAQAMETLGMCPDSLFRQLRNPSRRLFA